MKKAGAKAPAFLIGFAFQRDGFMYGYTRLCERVRIVSAKTDVISYARQQIGREGGEERDAIRERVGIDERRESFFIHTVLRFFDDTPKTAQRQVTPDWPLIGLPGSFFYAKIRVTGGEAMAWRQFNPNPQGAKVGDCSVRACCAATGRAWEPTFCALSVEAFMRGDMPSANHVWGAYLRRCGFKRHAIDDDCPDCYTVKDFCLDHPRGVFVLAINGHVVTVIDGDWFDTWDSGNEIPAYYWLKEGQ